MSANVIKCLPAHSLTYCLVCAGEMEVVQSKKAVMSARDPVLSQPVHGDRCTWEVPLNAMTDADIAQQHCRELVEELHSMDAV